MKIAIALVALALLGCTPSAPGSTTPPASSSPSVAVTKSAGPATPAATAPSQPATPKTESTPDAQTTAAPTEQPAAGMLAIEDSRVEGWLGTYCWEASCVDVLRPPPPETMPLLEVAAGRQLSFELGAEAKFVSWNAVYGRGPATNLMPLASGGSDYDPDTSATPPTLLSRAAFAAPPPGDWMVLMQVFFVGGDAQYGWHVVVD